MEINITVWIVLFSISGAGFLIEPTARKDARAVYPTEAACKQHIKDVNRTLGPMRNKISDMSMALSYVGAGNVVKMGDPHCVEIPVRAK